MPGVPDPANDVRVLMLTSSFPRAPEDPTAAFTREYAQALNLPGRILVPEPPGGQTLRRAGRMDVETVRYWWGGGPRIAHGFGIPDNVRRHPLTLLQGPTLLGRMAARARRRASTADVLVAHWAVPFGLVAARTAATTGLPLVTVLHSGGVHVMGRAPLGGRMAEYLGTRSSALVVTSRFVRDRFLALLRPRWAETVSPRVVVLPMGVHPGAEGPAPAGSVEPVAWPDPSTASTGPRALYLGRLAPVKGVDVLIQAAESCPGLRIDIGGDGPQRSALERMAVERGVHATFYGAVSGRQKETLFRNADFLVCPSRVLGDGRTESVPVVILEALARGVPVVCSRVGGIPEIVTDGLQGCLFTADDASSLASAMAELAARPDRLAEMGGAARSLGGHYTWKALGPLHRNVITRLASGRVETA